MRKGIYRHYKNKLYEVVDVAIHTETEEELVVYKALYDIVNVHEGGLWVRPLDMFLEKVEVDGISIPRFTYIGDEKYEHMKTS